MGRNRKYEEKTNMFFVSHSSHDADAAMRIVAFLENNQISCWIAPRNIIPGSSYPAQIVEAIRNCDGCILVSSETINSSPHINSEVARAFDMNKKIFPFLIEKMTYSDSYIYYIGQFQWIDAFSDFETGLRNLKDSILQTLNMRVPLHMPANTTNDKETSTAHTKRTTHIATYQDLSDLGMTALDIAKRLVENDYRLYPNMVVENEGSPEQWAEYLSTYPDTFRYLLNEKNEIVGNWSFLAVSEEIHAAKLAAGELAEETFSLDETEYLMFPGDYIGYLLNLSMNIGYNNPVNLNRLLTAFAEQMLAFAEEGIFFKSWYVNVFRKDHEAMYRRLGFSYLLNNKSFGKVYFLDCSSTQQQTKGRQNPKNSLFITNARLMELYHEHFMQET